MLIRRRSDVPPSEITPRAVFEQRRNLIGAAAAVASVPGTVFAQPGLAAGPGPFGTMERPTPAELVNDPEVQGAGVERAAALRMSIRC